MADAEAKAKAEKIAAAKKRVEQLKKAKAKKEASSKKSSAAEPATTEAATPDKDDDKQLGEPSSPVKEDKSPSGSPSVEELEAENKKLAEDLAEKERKWRKAEEELEELRETVAESTDGVAPSAEELERLKAQNAALERQLTQAQGHSRRSASISHSPPSDLAAELKAKSATIESMELEISNLQAQLQRVASGSSVEKEQIAALEEKLARTEKNLETSGRELNELKKNLDRTSEKAIKEGSSRTSAETKLKSLEKGVADLSKDKEELNKKVETLEKKITALTTLHKETEVRSQGYKKEKEAAEKEVKDLKSRLATSENDTLKARESLERSKKRTAEGVDDDGVDELESEVRQELERKIRALEAENFELKRGVWREGRKDLDPGLSPNQGFTDVDLSATSPHGRNRRLSSNRAGGGGLFGVVNAGLHALGLEDEELLEDDEDDFDEEAFRKAQEEEGMRQIERVKEIKRGLGQWKGWRMDLVELRRGGGDGVGEVFEV